jgi:hypothetical protein
MRPVCNTTIKAYRADKRELKPGQTVTTAGEFTDKHAEEGRWAEEVLEAARPPDKPARRKCLMVFLDEGVARSHWAKMADGKFYEVEIASAAIQHQADMQFVDQIGTMVTAPSAAEELAKRYWAGEMTESPKVEVLLPEAILVRLISDDQKERVAQFRKDGGIRGISDAPLDNVMDYFKGLKPQGDQKS